jgi:hypothetical protein
MTANLFVPPAAEGLPQGALDSATEGADRLAAAALTPTGRNFLAHALVQLARDGWLRPEPGEGFEAVRERPTVEPQLPAVVSSPPATDRATVLREAADRYEGILAKANTGQDPRYWTAVRDITLGLRRMADEAQQPEPAVGARQPDTETRPARGDQFEAWLKAQRDLCEGHASTWNVVDGLLDQYRLHADTGTPLDQHACDGPHCDCPPSAGGSGAADETRDETGEATP